GKWRTTSRPASTGQKREGKGREAAGTLRRYAAWPRASAPDRRNGPPGQRGSWSTPNAGPAPRTRYRPGSWTRRARPTAGTRPGSSMFFVSSPPEVGDRDLAAEVQQTVVGLHVD